MDDGASSFIVSVSGIAMMVCLVLIIISIFDIQTVSFAAIIGIIGLAIGLALQGSLSNFAGGFLIIVLKPFRLGDFIELNGTMGFVEDMDIFFTKLKTLDNKKVVIPNSLVINNTLVNYTEKNERRIDLNIGVSYSSDTKKVKKVISQAVEDNALLLNTPLPIIRLGEMADSALIFHVKAWCKTEDYWDAFYGMTEDIKDTLDVNNISIPFPQMDVHMNNELPK